MEWYLSLGLAITVLMGLFALGIPVFAAFLTINVLGTLWLMALPALACSPTVSTTA